MKVEQPIRAKRSCFESNFDVERGIRFDFSPYFANGNFLRDLLQELLLDDVRCVVLDMSAVNRIDTTAIRVLMESVPNFEFESLFIFPAFRFPPRFLKF